MYIISLIALLEAIEIPLYFGRLLLLRVLCFVFFFLAVFCGMYNLSSLTRDETPALGSGSMKS